MHKTRYFTTAEQDLHEVAVDILQLTLALRVRYRNLMALKAKLRSCVKPNYELELLVKGLEVSTDKMHARLREAFDRESELRDELGLSKKRKRKVVVEQ